jgi:hypothetical protein
MDTITRLGEAVIVAAVYLTIAAAIVTAVLSLFGHK